ncbi:Transcriptional corepressor SEUSS [Bienertia sinuspersici]
MVPSGAPTPIGGAQSVNPSILRSNSGMMGGQNGPMPSQGAFPSLVSPRNQFSNVNLLGNVPNVSSLLNQSYGNGGANPGAGSGSRGGLDAGAESDPHSHAGVGNGMGFNPPSSYGASSLANPSTSGQVQVQGQQFPNSSNNQMLADQAQSQQLESQNFNNQQQQFPANQQQQYRSGIGGVVPVKLEPQVSGDQHGSQQQSQLQSLRGLNQVKMEPQQLQNMRNIGPVKMEPQHSDQSMFMHQQQQHQQQQQQHQHQHQQQQHQQQQQQQQQLMQQMSMSRQSPQAAAAHINLLQQQRLLQLQQQQQQHQQHQLLKAMPQQRSPLQQQQFSPQNMPLRSPVKPVYEPGTCARRLTHYMYQQQHRPEDNNIEFWRKFVSEYFAPNAKKKWCVSMYGSGRQTTGVFPQDVWHCEICKRKPGRGFEATVEVLPRLFKIKYESGTLEELLYVDMPREYQNSAGQIVLDYAKAIQESVFDQLRVVRDGQLRIVFSSDLKICSWEFCARRHEELIPRRLLIPQVSQLGTAAQKYQAATQNTSTNMSVSDLQSNCNMFVASARQLAKTLEVPLVNDLGYTKRYVRCLQISEVVNSMKDLIDYSRSTGAGPMESLAKFPRRTSTPSAPQGQNQQSEEQQQHQQQQPPPQQHHPQQNSQQGIAQNSNGNDQGSVQAAVMQIASSNGVTSVNNNSHNLPSASTSQSTIAGLLHQNSMNSRQQNPMNNANSPYGGGGSSVQMPSPGSSNTMQQQTQPTHSPFQSPTPSSSNNAPQTSHGTMATTTNHMNSANSPVMSNIHQPALSGDGDTNDTQSSVQKLIQEMMMNSQLNGGGMMDMGSLGGEAKNIGGILPMSGNSALNGLVGNGPTSNNSSMSGGPLGSIGGGGMGQASMVNGIRAAVGSNSVVNGRAGIASMARDQGVNHQQQDLGNQMLNGLGAVNGFNSLQFDWKPSP